MKTVDLYFSKLCCEIDVWKDESKYWKEEYKKLEEKFDKLLKDDISHANTMSGIMFKSIISANETKLKENFSIKENKEDK